MMWCLAIIAFVGLASTLGASADSTSAALGRMKAARESGLPQVVIHDLKTLMAATDDAGEKRAISVELARCLIDAGRPGEALKVLDQPDSLDDLDLRYWTAEAYAAAGNYEPALQIFSAIADNPSASMAIEARLGEARMLEALGRTGAARASLQRVAKSPSANNAIRLNLTRLMVARGEFADAMRALDALPDPTRAEQEMATYLDGRISLDLGNADRALELFAGVSAARIPALRSGAVIGEVEALMSLNRMADAEARLEEYLDAHPNDVAVPELFAKLDELYMALPDASSAELRRWARDTNHAELASYAAFYLGRHELRAGRNPQALAAFTRFADQKEGHPLRADAIIHAVEMLYADGQIGAAFDVLSRGAELEKTDSARPQLQFLRAMLNLAAGREVAARSLFLNVANRFDDDLSRAAMENAALSEALAGDKWDPETASEAASVELQISETAALRKALIAARDLRRDDALGELARVATDPSTRARAAFAAAELATEQGRDADARAYFSRVVNQPGISPVQACALEVFLADDGSPESTQQVVKLSRGFLAEFPGSPRDAEVRMKLGEMLARSGDHRAAWVEFEQVGRDSQDKLLASSALYFAADAAAKSMDPEAVERSIELFEEVAQSDSPLAGRARLDQALIYNLLGRNEEALVLLGRLAAESENPEIQLAARMKLGDTLFAMGVSDPSRLNEAIAVWESLAREKISTPDRNEAITKAATAYEKLGNTDAALSGYYRVVDTPSEGEPEYFWFYKSGSDAARILEAQGRWEEAMIVYQKLADARGPRSAEAESRVRRLRLENFIWE